jgi:hypothetical protein
VGINAQGIGKRCRTSLRNNSAAPQRFSVKGTGLQRIKLPPANWFAPPDGNRSRMWCVSETQKYNFLGISLRAAGNTCGFGWVLSACLQQGQSSSMVKLERVLRYALTIRSDCLCHFLYGRVRDGLSPQALSSVGGKLVDRTIHTKNGRALAATEVEFSNPWCIVYGLRRVLVHRFRIANAIADIKYSNVPRSKTESGGK